MPNKKNSKVINFGMLQIYANLIYYHNLKHLENKDLFPFSSCVSSRISVWPRERVQIITTMFGSTVHHLMPLYVCHRRVIRESLQHPDIPLSKYTKNRMISDHCPIFVEIISGI